MEGAGRGGLSTWRSCACSEAFRGSVGLGLRLLIRTRGPVRPSCPSTRPPPSPFLPQPNPHTHPTRMPPLSKKRKSSVSSLSNPFEHGPPSPAPSAASSSSAPHAAASSTSSTAPPPAPRQGSLAPSAGSSSGDGGGGHPAVGGGVGELIGTGTGPGDVNEPGISLCVLARSLPAPLKPQLTGQPTSRLFFFLADRSESRRRARVLRASPVPFAVAPRRRSRRLTPCRTGLLLKPSSLGPLALPISHASGNRESAQRSRDAKKNHQTELEIRVAQLEAELAAARGSSSSSSTTGAPSSTTSTATNPSPAARPPPPPSPPKPDTNLVQRLALERDNADLRSRVARLEELVRGLVRLMGQAPVGQGSVVEPLSMGGLVDPSQHQLTDAGQPTTAAPVDGADDAAAAFGSFSPEEFAFAESLVANGALNGPLAAPAVDYPFPPSPVEMAGPSSSGMDGLLESASSSPVDFNFAVRPFDAAPTANTATLGGCHASSSVFTPPLFDLAPLPSSSSVALPAAADVEPRPLSPDYTQFLNPFATADDDDPLADFQFVSDPQPVDSASAGRRGSTPMSDVSFGSVSSSSTVNDVAHGFPFQKTAASWSNVRSNGSSSSIGSTARRGVLGHQTGASPSARWSPPPQRVPSPVLLPSSLANLPSLLLAPSPSTSATSRPATPTALTAPPSRPMPAMLRRTSSRPGSPMQISPPASPRTVPSFTLSAAAAPASPLRPTATALSRTTSTASLQLPPPKTTAAATKDSSTTASAASLAAAAAARGRSSRSALGRGSRHLQRVFSGTAAGATTTSSTGSSSSASPSSSASHSYASASTSASTTSTTSSSRSPRPAFPSTLARTASASALRLAPKRPISPLDLGALGLECLTDLMAQHSSTAGSGSTSGVSSGSASAPAQGGQDGPTEKMALVKQEFSGLGMGGLGSPRSVGCC